MQKLLHYLDQHSSSVVRLFPLGKVITNKDTFGMIVKWVLVLMGHIITYVPTPP